MTTPNLTMRRLGRHLESLRKQAGLTLQKAAESDIINRKSLQLLETGQIVLKWPIYTALAEHYGASRAVIQNIKDMALRATNKGWSEKTTSLTGFQLLLDLEPEATEIKILDPEGVTGLLQTEAYMRAIMRTNTGHDQAAVSLAVAERLRRKAAVFDKPSPPAFQFVMTEGALRREVGGKQVHEEQIAHLLDLESDDIDIRILPNTSGAYFPMNGPFTILGAFDSELDPDTVYLESYDGCRYLEGTIVGEFQTVFRDLVSLAVPLKEFLSGNPVAQKQ